MKIFFDSGTKKYYFFEKNFNPIISPDTAVFNTNLIRHQENVYQQFKVVSLPKKLESVYVSPEEFNLTSDTLADPRYYLPERPQLDLMPDFWANDQFEYFIVSTKYTYIEKPYFTINIPLDLVVLLKKEITEPYIFSATFAKNGVTFFEPLASILNYPPLVAISIVFIICIFVE